MILELQFHSLTLYVRVIWQRMGVLASTVDVLIAQACHLQTKEGWLGQGTTAHAAHCHASPKQPL
jgi:hypothetical protein